FLHRLVGRGHDPDIAACHPEVDFGLIDVANDVLHLLGYPSDGVTLMVSQKQQYLHGLATLHHQSLGGGVGSRAGHQAAGGAGYRRPARITLVVAGDGDLTHAGHAVHRVDAIDTACVEVQLLDRTHDI